MNIGFCVSEFIALKARVDAPATVLWSKGSSRRPTTQRLKRARRSEISPPSFTDADSRSTATAADFHSFHVASAERNATERKEADNVAAAGGLGICGRRVSIGCAVRSATVFC